MLIGPCAKRVRAFFLYVFRVFLPISHAPIGETIRYNILCKIIVTLSMITKTQKCRLHLKQSSTELFCDCFTSMEKLVCCQYISVFWTTRYFNISTYYSSDIILKPLISRWELYISIWVSSPHPNGESVWSADSKSYRR